MADILIKPPASDTDAVALYNQRLDGIRLKVSPDISSPITADLLPDSVIENPVYIRNAERRVLRDTKTTSVDTSASIYPDLVLMTQLRVAIQIIPQMPQVVQDAQLQDRVVYQEIEWELRIPELEEEYNNVIAEIVDDVTISGDIAISAGLTDSRDDRRDVIYDVLW